MTDAPDLLPCPFCGGKPYLANVEMVGCAYVVCTDCRVQGDDMSKDRAVSSWNARAGLQAIVNDAVLTAVEAMGEGIGEVNKLRLKAFKSNSVDDLSDYFQAAAMWFKQHEYRVIDAINKAKVTE